MAPLGPKRYTMPLCSKHDQSTGSWHKLAAPVPMPPALCANPSGNVKQCSVGNCRTFADRYEWRPATCQLVPWDVAAFCSRLGGRTMLWIGDSTMDEAARVVAAFAGWGDVGCAKQVQSATSDTLGRAKYGAGGRGPSWPSYVRESRPDVVVLTAGAHIHGDGNFEKVLQAVADERARHFPELPLIWKTSSPGGCAAQPLSELPDAAWWRAYSERNGYAGRYDSNQPRYVPTGGIFHNGTYNWREFQRRDAYARRFWAEHNGSVLDLSPLHYRADAHVGGADCLHMCLRALSLVPRLLLHLFVTAPAALGAAGGVLRAPANAHRGAAPTRPAREAVRPRPSQAQQATPVVASGGGDSATKTRCA